MTKEDCLKEFEKYKALNLHLDMSRGKPSKEQLDLSMPMLDILNAQTSLVDDNGNDCRNYGVLDGIDECKNLVAQMAEVNKENVIIFGNSSLNVMYELISQAFLYGINGCTPWSKLPKIKWLCPVPGYDRHFAITEHLGIEMILVPMNDDGPDMDKVEELVKDPLVKGIWCVPKYSNPTGISYSDEVVKRFAKLNPAAKDFRIFWDNAYIVHHLYEDKKDEILEIISECKKANNPDLVYEFISTSKITFPGSGIAAVISSLNNIKEIKSHLAYETIGFDKVNQLRHVRFFKDINGINNQMKKIANILRPKFELIDSILSSEVKDLATWNKPNGGYFISLDVKGVANEVISRCKEAGVILTSAGSTFPYHKDPNNSNIRIAPSYISLKELEVATKILCLAIKLETK